MNRNKKLLPIVMACLGLVLLGLRTALYAVALDEKNLLVSGHVLSWLIWAAAAACLVSASMAVLRTKDLGVVPVCAPVAALGDAIFAAAIGIAVISLGTPFSVVEKIRMVLGYLSVPCLCYSAFCRMKGKPVFFGCFAAVCVFFALYLVSFYRVWSSNPQLQDYVFTMLTCVTVTIFAYQNAAHAVGSGNVKVWLGSGLLAISFGIAAVWGGEHPALYLAGAVWVLTEFLSDRTRDRKKET